MQDIYVVVKDIDTTVTVMSAAFDADEAIIKADINPLEFSEGEIDIIEKSTYGRLALMTLPASKYRGVLTDEGIESIFEISNSVELTDYNGEIVEVVLNRVIEKLDESEEKTEWVNGLGLNVNNDSDDMFDIDSMIINSKFQGGINI